MAYDNRKVVPLKTSDDIVWLKDRKIRLERGNYKNANWQYRIRIPEVKYQYERKTTGTPSLEEAK